MNRRRDHERARHAYARVAEVRGTADREAYKIAVDSFGANVIRIGLLAAVRWAQRRRTSMDDAFLDDLATAGLLGLGDVRDGVAFAAAIRAASSTDYMLATRDALAAVAWFRKAVQADGPPRQGAAPPAAASRPEKREAATCRLHDQVEAVLRAGQPPAGFPVGLGLGPLHPKVDAQGKCAEKAEWTRALARTTVPDDYAAWFHGRWKPALARAAVAEVRTTGRLLVGAGDAAFFDVGLRIHHTWGVPCIPGSSLKGLLSHWLDVVYGPDREHDTHPLDPGHGTPDRARFRRATFPSHGAAAIHGPGEWQRLICGAPDVADDLRHLHDRGLVARDRSSSACRGRVHFHDALLVPKEGLRPFEADVLTPHHSLYARGLLDANDYESPVPVPFLTVAPGVRFLVALTADRRWEEWAAFALEHLLEALETWGAGSKTAAGYGRCAVERSGSRGERDATVVGEMRGWLAERFAAPLPATDDGPEAFVQAIRAVWDERMATMTGRERDDAVQAIKSFLSVLKRSRALVGKAYDRYRDAVKNVWGGP